MKIDARVQAVTSQGRINAKETFMVRLNPIDAGLGIRDVTLGVDAGSDHLLTMLPGNVVTVTVEVKEQE